jgi:hypothetical protein
MFVNIRLFLEIYHITILEILDTYKIFILNYIFLYVSLKYLLIVVLTIIYPLK